MKTCSYCGTENGSDAVECHECRATSFTNSTSGTSLLRPDDVELTPMKLEFVVPTPEQMKLDLITLLHCATLTDADLIVSELDSAGISAFIPDEFVMQNAAFTMNTRGNVRVQVSPKDYEEAKEFLSAAPARSSNE